MTDSALPYDSPLPETHEPFGQMGMRQYAGRVIAWVCITFCLSCIAIGHRSMIFDDQLRWQSGGQMLAIDSIFGRLVIRARESPVQESGNQGWTYLTNYYRTVPDGWRPSIWKTIGMEMGSDLRGGFWLRVKWSFLAIVAAIQPVCFILMAFKRWVIYRE